MRNHKPNPERVRNIYHRYLSKYGYNDIWARELINGFYEIDDINCFGDKPFSIEGDTFLSRYELFEEINNGLD